MKNLLILIVAFMSFALTSFGHEPIVPIAFRNVLIGGSQNGNWLADYRIADSIEPNSKFIGLDGKDPNKRDRFFGTLTGTSEVCGVFIFFFSYSDSAPVPSPDSSALEEGLQPLMALGADAKWDPFPRARQELGKTDKTYTKIVADFLKTKRIVKTTIVITDAFRIDLDGDGAEETILSATYFKDPDIQEARSAGDYSFTIIRRTNRGKSENILLEGEFFPRRTAADLNLVYTTMYPNADSPAVYAVADLNGDGSMEIVLHGTDVYSFNSDKATAVFETDSCLN